jgi:uncharacterized protein (TIGR02118 family)
VIKVSVPYPNREGSRFDMTYYCETHIPMVKVLLGPALKGVAVEQGIAGKHQARRLRTPRWGISNLSRSKRFRQVLDRTHRRS